MTVSAAYKFSPKPPALVDNRKILKGEFYEQKRLIRVGLSSAFVEPSNLRYLIPLYSINTSMMSKSCVIWEKMSILCPVTNNLCSILSNNSNLPDDRHTSSLGLERSRLSRNRYGWLQILRSCIIRFYKARVPVLPVYWSNVIRPRDSIYS